MPVGKCKDDCRPSTAFFFRSELLELLSVFTVQFVSGFLPVAHNEDHKVVHNRLLTVVDEGFLS